MIVPGEPHLHRVLSAYLHYYHEARPRLALERNAPAPRASEAAGRGKAVAIPHLGGLHHQFARAA